MRDNTHADGVPPRVPGLDPPCTSGPGGRRDQGRSPSFLRLVLDRSHLTSRWVPPGRGGMTFNFQARPAPSKQGCSRPPCSGCLQLLATGSLPRMRLCNKWVPPQPREDLSIHTDTRTSDCHVRGDRPSAKRHDPNFLPRVDKGVTANIQTNWHKKDTPRHRKIFGGSKSKSEKILPAVGWWIQGDFCQLFLNPAKKQSSG